MSLDWLTARPIAHRGLHDAGKGVIENTPSAVKEAIAGNYGIEVDLQISADGEAFVHHDFELGRLTEGSERLADMPASAIRQTRFKATSDDMMTLGELCDLVAGRVTMTLELKSRFDGDRRVAQRTAQVLANYAGPVGVMSFDPDMIATLRAIAPSLTRGIVAEYRYSHHEWDSMTWAQKTRLAYLLHANVTRPHFIAYCVRDLPALGPFAARTLFGCPLLTWTVRSETDRACAARWADQMIFEGFRP